MRSAPVPRSCRCATPRPRILPRCSSPMLQRAAKLPPIRRRNAIIVSGDAAVRQTLVESDPRFRHRHSGRSVLRPVSGRRRRPRSARGRIRAGVSGARPKALWAASSASLPMDRVNAVLVVSSQPRYIDAAKRFVGLFDRVEDATARSWHVYYVQNGQSADLENCSSSVRSRRAMSPRPAARRAALRPAPSS